MKVGIFSTFDHRGGAARAAYRLHKGMLNSGVLSKMFVHVKESDDDTVIKKNSKIAKIRSLIVPTLDSAPLLLYPKREKRIFSVGCLSSTEIKKVSREIDVVNLHWISGGFLSIRSISQLTKPLVLTLHDSWAFTGGCHIPFECEKFMDKCGSCIQLHSESKMDLSSSVWKSKFELLSKRNIVLVGDGNWVAENARRSSIFRNHRVEVVHPGLDLNVFKPVNKKSAREILGVEEGKKVVLYGAYSATTDANKGFHLLVPALKRLSTIYTGRDIKLIVFGSSASEQSSFEFGLEVQFIGKMNDDISLSVLYSAADVMVVPSIQESFGQTASESFACGTPVVAFRTTGLVDIIDHQLNGYLAKPYDSDDLASGIEWVLADSNRLNFLGIEARKKAVRQFGIERCVNEYLRIYESVLKGC